MKNLRFLNSFLWKYKWRLSLGVLFVILQNYFRLLVPPQFRKALDLVVDSLRDYNATATADDKTVIVDYIKANLITFSLWVLAFAAMMGIFMYAMRQTIIVVSRLIEYDLRKMIYSKYQELDASFYTTQSTGDLMSRITEDLSKTRMYLGPGLLYIFNLITLLVIATIYMYNVNKTLTIYALAPLPIMSFSIYYVSSIINRRSTAIQVQLAKVTSIAQEVFSGIRVVKSYGRTDQFKNHFHNNTANYRETSLSLVTVNSIFHPLMLLLVSLSILMVVIVGGNEVSKGTITYGNIAEFIIYVNMLTWPFAAVGWIVSIIQEAEAGQRRINEFLFTQPNIVSPSVESDDLNGTIEFKNVSFSYQGALHSTLKDISFTVLKGEKLGIIGKTASGKSTIANLLLRLYDISQGEILIDGIDIKEHNLYKLRRSIGYVPQDAFLFSTSINNNVAFGVEEVNQELIEQMSRHAAVYDDIIDFQNGFETLVGERGVTLSGGQKQRIAIARALIKSPEIIILDDCLSAVDTTTEQTILAYLKDVLADKTAIIITHRIYKHLNFDKIIVLEDGKIIESGTPEDLIALKGYYYELLNSQQLEEVT